MRSILLVAMGAFLFFCGHYVGFERALTQKHEMTYTLKLGDTPTVQINHDGSVTCGIGAVQSLSPKEATTATGGEDVSMKVTGAQAESGTMPRIHEWKDGTKFVIGRDGQWEQREGKCTAADLNCMD